MKIIEITQAKAIIEISENTVCAYVNSTRGRNQMEAECPAEIVADVYKTWGSIATITETVSPSVPANTTPTLDDRVKALEAAQLAALGV